MKLEKILLATDFSDSSGEAYPVAASLAKKFGATLHLVHVAESMPPYFFLHGMGIRTDVPSEPYLDELEKKLETEGGSSALKGVTVETKLLYHGHPYEAVCDYVKENEIDLAVLSTHGHSAVGYLFLGSFAQKIVRHSRAPVLAYRARKDVAADAAEYAPGEILVPYDFSENARAVVPLLRYLGEHFGSKFTFLYVQDPLPQFVDTPMGGDLAAHLQQAIEEAPKKARALFEELQGAELAGLDVRIEIGKGAPQREIIQYAEQSSVDLIVQSTHGWSGLKHYFLGSVAETVLRRAPCSVLTVRPREAREG